MNDPLTHEIIGAAYQVHNVLGSGFLEKVYENALVVELQKRGLEVQQQYPIPVFYEDVQVGDYFADLWVAEQVIVDLKAIQQQLPIHEVQLVNYLQGARIDIGLLINFGQTVEVKRKYRVYRGDSSGHE